jgi:hypothetical protein
MALSVCKLVGVYRLGRLGDFATQPSCFPSHTTKAAAVVFLATGALLWLVAEKFELLFIRKDVA